MHDYPIDPPIVLKDRPKRKLRSLREAHDFIEETLREHRFVGWREMLERVRSVSTDDEAVETIGALRELLDMEHLAEPISVPPVTSASD